MKKTISCTLAATIAAAPLQGFANEIVEVNDNSQATEVSQPTEITGKLEVDMNFYLPIMNSLENDMKVTLNGDGVSTTEVLLSTNSAITESGISYTVEKLDSKRNLVTNENAEVSFIRVIFENLPKGTYNIELSGSGYKTATVDNIDITTYSKRVKVGTKTNSVITQYGETTEDNKIEEYPALFLAGNINTDNIINMDDYNIVLNSIKKNENKYDINKDSKTDISDLSAIKSSIGTELITDMTKYILDTDPIIDPNTVSMSVEEGIKVNGLDGESAKEALKELLTSETSTVTIGNPAQVPSAEKPIKVDLDLTSNTTFRLNEAVEMEQVVIKAPSSSSENSGAPESGYIVYTGSDDKQYTVNFGTDNLKKSRSGNDEIVIDLGSQVAVKSISINVTKNRGNKNISEIAKIEFLNNVYKELPKPELSIPTIKTLETSTELHDERITISWEAQPNVTAYEVRYYKIDDKGNKVGSEKKLQTNKTNLNILDKAIKPYDKFRVSIQSLNGEWSSGYAEDLEKDGKLSEEEKQKLIPYNLDGTADNVDKDFNKIDTYYGLNGKEANMGSVSDIQVIPIRNPEPPRNLTVKEGYRSLTVSWEDHRQARDFDIYYRKLGDSNTQWIKANDPRVTLEESEVNNTTKDLDKTKLVRSHSYTLNGLDDESTYEVRVTATNHLGTSQMSQVYLGTTTTLKPAKLPNYKVINTPKDNVVEGEIPVNNVVKVTNATHVNVSYDNEFAVVDNDYSTKYKIKDWNPGNRTPIVEFNEEYSIDRISIAWDAEYEKDLNWPGLYNAEVVAYDESGNESTHKAKWSTTTSSNGKKYYTFKFEEPITAKKIQVKPYVYSGYVISIAEIKFHESDNIERDIKALYKDEFRVELRAGVTQEDIDNIRTRLNTMDPVSKEYNPDRTNLLKELDVAESLLIGADLSNQITTLDPTIKNNSGSTALGLGMKNDWQSLGSVARPGKDGNQKKKIVVYVGSNNSNARVQIGFLQNYGQPGKYINESLTLGPGRHEITIPEIISEDVEKGGQVMARVTSNTPNATIKVRLAGVDEIPHLNVNNLINDKNKETEVKEIIRTYIRNLKKHVTDLPNMYPNSVTAEDRKNNIYTYDPQTSTLNATDIEGDRFTLTVPASQILKGIEEGLNGNENAQVERVYNALLAWEQQMQLIYAKKGVYETGDKATGNHVAPTSRMNIKYQRMMMGAAGYASSHHVGVGYGGVSAYMQGVPFKFDDDQNVINKDEAHFYGDLIAHETGHVVDIAQRTYEETSNNLMVALTTSMLNQNPSNLGKDTYQKMYEKATSHTLGLSTNRSVVLGMLWQPHLAYEDRDTYKMLFNDDSYFARLNRAYRDMTDEEKADADKDQLLIRMTSKVANKDLSDFYLAYGIVPNQTTLNYVSKFEKETRPIQYINDEARRQRLAGTADMSSDTEVVASFGKDNKGKQIVDKAYVNQSTVPINLSVTKDSNRILGYEIYRNGAPVGFVERNSNGGLTTYNDVVDNTNNRVFKYEVVAYDYNLKATKKFTLGTIKVRHDGSVNKSNLDITSNTIDINDSNYDEHADNPNPSLANIIDNNDSTVYEGKKYNTKEDPYIIIDTNEVRSLAGIKYTAPTTTTKLFNISKTSKSAIQNYKVEVSKDGNNWTTVKVGQFKLDSSNPTETIYFDKEGVEGGKQLNVYNTRFVKLTAIGAQNISVAELDLIAPPGDNIEIGVADDNINYKNGLGILKEDFVYQVDNPDTKDVNEEKKIPAGSIIITGEYRGNPAFNVPLVLNENEEHIADKYNGILMAEVPDNGDLEEISEGNWIYWVEPKYAYQFMQNKQIFAELYRTDTADAQSDGQRLVSDSFKIDVPDELPEISLSGGQGKARSTIKYTEIKTKTLKEIKNNR